jgi:hypothetical protein
MLSEMAKIFYLGGGSHARGMLRAVVPLYQLESFLAPELVIRLGHAFPKACDGPITLIEISHEEATAAWPAGYCRVEACPSDFDERLRFLPEPTRSGTTTSNVRSGSGLIHGLTRDMR